MGKSPSIRNKNCINGYAKRFINGDGKGLGQTTATRKLLSFIGLRGTLEHDEAARELLRTGMVIGLLS
jgi:hypothetical protein